MADTSTQQIAQANEPSLQALLTTIDHEVAASLAADLALGKERAARSIRKRVPYIAFVLGDHEMALSLDSIREIGYLPAVTPLPNLPGWIQGVIQIRGEILSVLDLPLLFNLKENQRYQSRKSYILFQYQKMQFCLQVSRILGVVNIDNIGTALQPPSAQLKAGLGGMADFMQGAYVMEDRTVCILDREKLGTSALIKKW